jgi:flavodoxin, long chain
MKTIGLIYSFNSNKTAKIAEKIKEQLNDSPVDLVNAETITEEEFMKYDNLILGVPTWFDGELPGYWDEFGPALEDLNLKGKQIALYGLGDQVDYPENFLDGVGVMAKLLEGQGAKIVGKTSVKGYTFEHSKAQQNDQFLGLAIDFENQASLNKERVSAWVKQLLTEFK